MTKELDLTADVIDVRDIIARAEELEATLQDRHAELTTAGDTAMDFEEWVESLAHDYPHDEPDAVEALALRDILSEIKGMGGDEQWRGDWYPVTLIRDSYFKEYAQEMAEDCGMIEPSAVWPYTCVDWDQAARELRCDYTGVDIDGVTYWTR